MLAKGIHIHKELDAVKLHFITSPPSSSDGGSRMRPRSGSFMFQIAQCHTVLPPGQLSSALLWIACLVQSEGSLGAISASVLHDKLCFVMRN